MAIMAVLSSGAHAGDADLPRLSGIVAGPHPTAVFARPDGSSLVVGEGGKIGAYSVETIRPDAVVVIGPDGARLSELEPEARTGRKRDDPAHATALGELAAGGRTIGRLAIQRDNCVRRGLLPGARIDAESRVRHLLQLIAGAPPPRNADPNATPQAIAAATSAGLDSARRSAVVVLTTEAACRGLDTAWRQQAARFGVR